MTTASHINTKTFLGSLCKRYHEYQNTGMSLRYCNSKSCIKCVAIITKQNRPKRIITKEQRQEKREYDKKYRKEGRKTKADHNYYLKTIHKRKLYAFFNRDKIRKNHTELEKIRRHELDDNYIKNCLFKLTGLLPSKVSDLAIKLKREQIMVHRALKQLKEVINE